MNKILTIKNLSKTFPGVKALDNIDFDLYEGEIHCLVGENGAGKSTFIKILSGAYIPDTGNIEILNKEFINLTPLQAIDIGIQTVYQESILVPTLSVGENIFLGNEITNKYGAIDLNTTFTEAKKLLERLGIDINPKAIIENLTTAEKQVVGIIKALSRKAKILILDEPTASLSSIEIDRLLKLVKEIKKTKAGIIYISHHLEEVFEIGDRITVLKDGKKINTHLNKELNYDLLIKEMVGREASLFYYREKVASSKQKLRLSIKNFNKGESVKDVSFTVLSGEIFGIGGMVGSGRTELARIIVGVDRRDSGQVFLNDKEITPNSPFEAIRNGICLISEGRQKDGLVLSRSIIENVSLPTVNLNRKFFINLRKELKGVSNITESLRVAYYSLNQEVRNLSGGNQQKVVLAKWLYTSCNIFIFDEPTLGIDIGSKMEIYNIMTELLRENKIIIMISSDMPELISMSDNIGIMRKGSMVNILNGNNISEENILSYSIGTN